MAMSHKSGDIDCTYMTRRIDRFGMQKSLPVLTLLRYPNFCVPISLSFQQTKTLLMF